MAQIQDRKKDFYSHKQSVREEFLAPAYLESAGDRLVKDLARKQLETRTTLQEQLMVQQNFRKGSDLVPDNRKGVCSLDELKSQTEKTGHDEEGEIEDSVTVPDMERLKKTTGLSRHELELSLCEKPNSNISKLYKFALGSKTQRPSTVPSLEHQLQHHPINHLNEIEEEYFGHLRHGNKALREGSTRLSSDEEEATICTEKAVKKRKRKRRRKQNVDQDRIKTMPSSSELTKTDRDATHEVSCAEDDVKPKSFRPSLWDVKDMKKWCQVKKTYGCKPQTLYTIKDGKIIKLEDLKNPES